MAQIKEEVIKCNILSNAKTVSSDLCSLIPSSYTRDKLAKPTRKQSPNLPAALPRLQINDGPVETDLRQEEDFRRGFVGECNFPLARGIEGGPKQ